MAKWFGLLAYMDRLLDLENRGRREGWQLTGRNEGDTMREYTDGCIYVTARNLAEAKSKLAKQYARLRAEAERERKATAAWARDHEIALNNLCAGR